MPKYLKGKVCKTMTRPVLIYGPEAWTVTRREEGLLERTEMRMLWRMLGVSLKDKKRNEVIRKTLGVACITDKIREARLRWYGGGHVMRRGDENSMKRIMMSEVNGRLLTLQSRMAEEALGRHDTTKHEVSLIKERTYW